MAYVFTEPSLGLPAITSHVADETDMNAAGRAPGPYIGMIAQAVDPTYGNGEFIYLQGLDATVLGSWVTYNADDFTTALLAANAVGPVAIAMAATVTGENGWYQISGKGVGKALASYADNGAVFATATAGSVDDAVVAGDRVHGAKGASAVDTPSTGLAEFEIDRPYTNNAQEDAEDRTFSGTVDITGTLELGGVAVTASAAELNIMDGVTATAAEINAAADVSSRIVSIPDAATYTALVANSGKTHVFPDLTASCTVALPAVAAGLEYTFIGKGVAADAQNWVIQSASATNFFLGGVAFADTDAGAGADEIHAGVWSNGSSNDFLTVNTPGAGTLIYMICDGTNWIVNGQVFSATAPAFSDT